MADREPEIRAIFCEALELPTAAAQSLYVKEACQGNPELRNRIEGLLEAHRRAGAFSWAEDQPLDHTIDVPPIGERAGAQIGRYKLLEEIGEGGFGVVYLAEQQEPVRRQVAFKLIKPGMDTREVVTRFEAERQALALMDHPSIARVHDAGATESGRPYFVMELVHGIPITEYCDRHEMSIRERLELFIPVCQAVQHAHHKGIIHRDLKPSNVLVTVNEDVPLPKVIDFGVAKATGKHLTDGTTVTGMGQLVGTPMYMSPEQAGRGGQDVDTRSDIYSLGVLLYELLTGTTPFNKERFRHANYDEICAIIREQEPVTPSSRITTVGEGAITISAHRHASPSQLSRTLRGELDWIVMKALEKDRRRRYQTATALAQDIERYLHDEPVEACPPSGLYRLRKFARRHRTAVTATLAVALALLLGAAIAADQAIRAREAEQQAEAAAQTAQAQTKKAEQAAAIAQEINRFLNEDVLGQADPSRHAVGKQPTLLEVVDEAAQKLEGAFSERPEIQAALHRTIGQTYRGLGQYEKSAAHYRAGLDILRRQESSPQPESLDLMIQLGAVLGEQGQFDAAEAILKEALETSRRTLGIEHALVLDALVALCKVQRLQEKKKDTLDVDALLRQHVGAAERKLGQDHPATLTALDAWAGTLHEAGKAAEAEPLLRQVVERRRRVLGADDPATLQSVNRLALVLMAQRKLVEAEQQMRANLRAKQRVLGESGLLTLEEANNLAGVLAYRGKYEEAEVLFRSTLKATQERLGPDHPLTLDIVNNLCWMLTVRNRLDDAEQLLRSNWQALRDKRGPGHLTAIVTGTHLGRLLLHRGAFRQAEEIGRAGLAAAHNLPNKEHSARGDAAILLASALYAQCRQAEADGVSWEDFGALFASKSNESLDWHLLACGALDKGDGGHAEEWARTAVDEIRRIFPLEPPIALATSLALYGRTLIAQDKAREAEPILRECLAIRQAALPPGHWLIAETESLLGLCLTLLGRHTEAEPILVNSAPAIENSTELSAGQKVEAWERLVWLYENWDKEAEAQLWSSKLEGEIQNMLSALRTSQPEDTVTVGDLESRLGKCLAARGRHAEGERLLLQSFDQLSTLVVISEGNARRRLERIRGDALHRVAQFYRRQGQVEHAEAWELLAEIASPSLSPSTAAACVTAWESQVCQRPDQPLMHVTLAECCLALAAVLQRQAKSEHELQQVARQALDAFATAEASLHSVLQMDAGNRRASQLLRTCYLNRAESRKSLGQYQEAFADFERAIALAPDDAVAMRLAADAMVNCPDPAQRRLERSLALATNATALAPDDRSTCRTLGTVQFRVGRWTDAIESLSKLVQPDDAGGNTADRLFLSMAFWQLGDQDAARTWFERAEARMAKRPRAPSVQERADYEQRDRLYREARGLLGIGADDALSTAGLPRASGKGGSAKD